MRPRSNSFTLLCENGQPNASQESMKRIIAGTVEERERAASLDNEDEREQGATREEDLELVENRLHSNDIVPRPWVATNREWWMVACFALMGLVVSLNGMVAMTILPNLSTALGASPTDTLWPATSYFLANAIMQRFFVAVAQVLGRRIVLFTAVGIFTFGTAVSCISPVFPVLLVGRSLQGIGSGGMVSVPLAILTDTVPAHRRSGYNGIILLVSAIGALLGPVVGGVFMERHVSWLWVFYISLPICAVLLTSSPIIVRPVGEQLSPRRRLLSIDWTGGTLFTVSMVSCLLGITWYGLEDPSKRWPTLIALGAGTVGVVCTLLYEKMGASQPFFPFPIVKKSPVTFICIYLHSLLMFTELYYIPVYLKAVKGFSPSLAGTFIIPITAIALSTAAVVGMVTSRYGHFRWAIWSGWALNIASAGCMMLMDVDIEARNYVLIFILAGLGHGLTVSATHTAVQRLADTPDICDASIISSFVRTLGICVSIPMVGAAFQNRLASHLIKLNVPREFIASRVAQVFLLGPSDVTIPPYRVKTVRLAYARSFQNIALGLTVVAGLGGLLSLFVGWKSRRRGYR